MDSLVSRVPYRVVTERLLLRCWTPLDAPRVRAALDRSDAHLRPFIPFMRHEPRSLEGTAQWLRERRAWFDGDVHYCYGIFSEDAERLLGETMLLKRGEPGVHEIGYWIDVSHVGKGYATEAAALMCRMAFDVFGMKRVEIQCSPDNPSSERVAEKLGFVHETTLAPDPSTGAGELMVWARDAHDASAGDLPTVRFRAFDVLNRELRLEEPESPLR